MKEKRWFTVVYMFLVTAFFSSIVIGFSRLTAERVKANEQLNFEKAVLTVLPGLYDEKLSGLQLHRRFLERVTPPAEETGAAYTLRENGKTIAYALPLAGEGFWAPIKGVLGIADDLEKIIAIAFYEQNETPGLGAQIVTPQFTDQFKHRKISPIGKPLTIKRPGETLGPSDVHAVTGATQTSIRLEKLINAGLEKWRNRVTQRSDMQ